MNKNEYNDIKNNYNHYKNERKRNRFYPATKLHEKIIMSSEVILILLGFIGLALLPLAEIFGSIVYIILIMIFVLGPPVIYMKNTFIYPRLFYKNYNNKIDLFEEYKVVTETKNLNYNPLSEGKNKNDIFKQNSTRRLDSKGYNIVCDSDEAILGYKVCKPQDRRVWWTYSLYKKLKFNIIFINGSVSNEKLLELNCLESEYENFIIRIHTEELFSETQKDLFLFSSERNLNLVSSYHLKLLEIGYELSTGKFYYRNPYIRVEYNSFLIKNRIRVKNDNSSGAKSIHDIESTEILKRQLLKILKM